MTPLLTIPLLALFVTTMLHICAIQLFPKYGLLDFPHRYALKRNPLPYPTGVVPVVVFLVFYAFIEGHSNQFYGLSIGIIILSVVSFIDDRRQLPWHIRLVVQILAALMIFATGTQIYTITNPLEGLFGMRPVISLDSWDMPYQFSMFNVQFLNPLGTLPIWSGIFTILWLGLTMNALNWFDGIPGQVSTLSTIGFMVIGLLSISSRVNQPEIALLAFTLAGISLSCLLFDFPPAKVLMGDTGAMFFGLMLGVLTIYAGGKVATGFLVLGIPLIDFVLVIVQRIRHGKSPFTGSLHGEHLHHRLLKNNWTYKQLIFFTGTIGTAFGCAALFLSTFEKFVAALILFIIVGGLSGYTRKM